jgi:hypothetical protein
MESVVVPVPVFFTETGWLALVVPTVCDVNVRLDGVGATITENPVPVRLTDCGEFDAWSVIMIDPVRVPVAVGVKVTLNVQLAPAPSELPQVLLLSA